MIPLSGQERILEVGVGTGISLTKYPRTVGVVGIDLSEDMLKKAQERVERYALTNVELLLANAEEMSFQRNHFDKVIIMYVLSVTPNPEILLEKALDVCKEGGEVIIVNHFSEKKLFKKLSSSELSRRIERRLGFRVYFPMKKYIEHINTLGHSCTDVKSANYGLSKIIKIKKNGVGVYADNA